MSLTCAIQSVFLQQIHSLPCRSMCLSISSNSYIRSKCWTLWLPSTTTSAMPSVIGDSINPPRSSPTSTAFRSQAKTSKISTQEDRSTGCHYIMVDLPRAPLQYMQGMDFCRVCMAATDPLSLLEEVLACDEGSITEGIS